MGGGPQAAFPPLRPFTRGSTIWRPIWARAVGAGLLRESFPTIGPSRMMDRTGSTEVGPLTAVRYPGSTSGCSPRGSRPKVLIGAPIAARPHRPRYSRYTDRETPGAPGGGRTSRHGVSRVLLPRVENQPSSQAFCFENGQPNMHERKLN